MSKKKDIKDRFDLMIDTHLNGEWKLFVKSCEEIQCSIEKMSKEEVKELKEELKIRINKA